MMAWQRENRSAREIGLGAVAIGVALLLPAAKAEAATIFASSATIITDGPRGTSSDRNEITNAFGAADGAFFELGYNAVVEFQFGIPTGQAFSGPGSLIEITNGNADNWLEAVRIDVGLKGDPGSFVTADPNPFTNNSGSTSFTFNGVFDTVRLTDLTMSLYPNTRSTAAAGGGFDVDAIGVSPVPVPAAGLLLLTAVGGVAALRRRRKAAAT